MFLFYFVLMVAHVYEDQNDTQCVKEGKITHEMYCNILKL